MIREEIHFRLLHASRVSLFIGFFVVIISSTVGVILGVLAGFYGGRIDHLVMRSMDVLTALPRFHGNSCRFYFSPGLENAILAVAVVSIPSFTRIVRQVFLKKKKKIMKAARIFGTSDLKIMFTEILPNCMAPLIIQIWALVTAFLMLPH